jgi:hypothetical protein
MCSAQASHSQVYCLELKVDKVRVPKNSKKYNAKNTGVIAAVSKE